MIVSISTHNVGEGKIAIAANGAEMVKVSTSNYREMQGWLREKQHTYKGVDITFDFRATGSAGPEDPKEIEDAKGTIDMHLKMLGGGAGAAPTQATSSTGGPAVASPPGAAAPQAASSGVATMPPPSPPGAPNQQPLVNRPPAAASPPAQAPATNTLPSRPFGRRLLYLFTNK